MLRVCLNKKLLLVMPATATQISCIGKLVSEGGREERDGARVKGWECVAWGAVGVPMKLLICLLRVSEDETCVTLHVIL